MGNFVVFLDGKGAVQSLQQQKETEQSKLGNKKQMRKSSFICTLIACFVIVIGIILLVIGLSVAVMVIFFGGCCFCIAIPCYFHSSNRGYLNSVYTEDRRKGLQFDVSQQCVKKIVFSTNYGLNRKARSHQERDNSLHEPIVEIVSVEMICGFNQISGIGKEEKVHSS